MRDVIEEREKRRHNILKIQAKLLVDAPRTLLENLYREEHVEPTAERPSGFKPVAIRMAEHALP
jgi:hypothetical protein